MKALALIPLAALAMLLAPSAAHAQAKFEIGGRLGYGIPLGKVRDDSSDADLSDAMTGQVPLWLDIGARITPNFFLGGYLGVGIGIPADQFDTICDSAEASGADCTLTALDLRLGVQALYHFAPGGTDPWLGAGLGYERVSWGYNLEAGNEEADLTLSASGFEFLNLQAGVDFPVGKTVALGPFATFTFAQYGSVSMECSGICGDLEDLEEDIDDKALHDWLFLGVRLTAVL